MIPKTSSAIKKQETQPISFIRCEAASETKETTSVYDVANSKFHIIVSCIVKQNSEKWLTEVNLKNQKFQGLSVITRSSWDPNLQDYVPVERYETMLNNGEQEDKKVHVTNFQTKKSSIEIRAWNEIGPQPYPSILKTLPIHSNFH